MKGASCRGWFATRLLKGGRKSEQPPWRWARGSLTTALNGLPQAAVDTAGPWRRSGWTPMGRMGMHTLEPGRLRHRDSAV